jgi:hypothetical protein
MNSKMSVKNVNFEHPEDEIKIINSNSVIVENGWSGPVETDHSFSAELSFNISDKAPRHCMLLSCRSNVRFGGWNLQIVGSNISLQIGNGNTWCSVKGPVIKKNTWHHVAWSIDNKTDKAMLYLDGVKFESSVPGNYVKATNQLIVGALSSNERNFRFDGQIKGIKLGSGLELVNIINTPNYESITDIPVVVNELDVSSFINILDQYSSDRTWIKQAVNRLKQELQEEMDLNKKLKELDSGNGSFLVSKVEKFMNEYASEIDNTEKELQQIYNDLQKLITENEKLMNNNKALKDKMVELNNNGTDKSITNIRKLIDDNIKLLKDSNRWGDTSDSAFKIKDE